jgi:hypothetical protein
VNQLWRYLGEHRSWGQSIRNCSRRGYISPKALRGEDGQCVAKDQREDFVGLNLAAQCMGDKYAITKVNLVRDEIAI